MIEAVFLDAGGVLLVPRTDAVGPVLRDLGGRDDPDTVDRCHFAAVAAWDRSNVPEEEVWPTYFAAYAAEAGVPADRTGEAVERLWDAFRAPGVWRRVLPGARETLAALGAARLPVVVVSNSAGHVEEDLRVAGVCRAGAEVVCVLDSSVVGVAKPDPGIFRIALDAVGAAAERAVHVGDSVTSDVRGAEAAGVRPLHLDPYGFCAFAGHEHIRSLPELVERLSGSA